MLLAEGRQVFFCAVNAARLQPQLRVTILEKTGKVLSKVKVSGGGRCNTTHFCFDVNELVQFYPRGKNFLKKTFHQFGPADTVEWFKQRRVNLKTEGDGRMFPVTDNSQTIIDCLLQEANRFGVTLLLHADVKAIERGTPGFSVALAGDRHLQADYVCVACGGFAKASHFDWLRELSHTIEEPVPSLFTFNMPGNAITALMGVSVPNAQVKVAGSKLMQAGPLLITHWGMSGPAILRLSAWGARYLAEQEYRFQLLVNWIPEYTAQTLREAWSFIRTDYSQQKMGSKNPFQLPARLWAYLLQQCEVDEQMRWSELPSRQQNKLIQHLTQQVFEVSGKTTFKEEFVTCGGVKTAEIEPSTMESRVVPGLYFAGEIMDIDGVTGGFNFQHAWTSGWIAAKAIAASEDRAADSHR